MLGAPHDAGHHRPLEVRLEGVAIDAGQELREERGIHPSRRVTLRLRRVDEVEEVDDRRGWPARVRDERVLLGEPAHRDLPAVAHDLLGHDRAALLRDAEERLEEHAPLRAAAGEPAGLIGARERVEDRFDGGDPPRVLPRHVVDAPQDAHEVEERLADERRPEVGVDDVAPLRAAAPGRLRHDVNLRDAGVDALLELARRLGLGKRDDRADDVRPPHPRLPQGDELIEEEDGQAALLLLGLGLAGRDDRRDGRRGRGLRPCAAPAPSAASKQARALGLDPLRSPGLGVVGAQARSRPARLGDEVLEQEDLVAKVR